MRVLDVLDVAAKELQEAELSGFVGVPDDTLHLLVLRLRALTDVVNTAIRAREYPAHQRKGGA